MTLLRKEVGVSPCDSDGQAHPARQEMVFMRRFLDLRAKDHEVYILGFSVKKLTYANPVKHELEHR